ncbi:Zn-ribbon domain-containing OB-fold protein [Halomicrobium sp. HM KBTZ05]|uniref:Nucleic acid-binding protein n=1 Tax=Halomicrobium mukohataei TaxID=57705 RepID=A0A847UDA4_9EURY|nr:OB-fold domain-containing protein [Halomicrobium mukohataei]NLV11129.1 nucleic acid-binding protein [Halomicrobium mukohataei]
MTDRARDGAFDDWLDALAAADPYYLGCENGHGWLPPRRVCPDCGSRKLSRERLPDAGKIATHTAVHVATPQFEDDAPYVTAIADFGPVSITGLVRGVEPDAVEIGTTVGIEIGERETTGERAVVFRPR